MVPYIPLVEGKVNLLLGTLLSLNIVADANNTIDNGVRYEEDIEGVVIKVIRNKLVSKIVEYKKVTLFAIIMAVMITVDRKSVV